MYLPLVVATALLVPGEGVKFLDTPWQETLAEAGKQQKLVFLDFYTDW